MTLNNINSKCQYYLPKYKEYTMEDGKPFGFESMPQKWPGSSSTFGRRVKTNCHAEYPKNIKWGKNQININLYNKHYNFKQHEYDNINNSNINSSHILSTYPQPTYIIKSKSVSNGYNILLLQMNGIFENETIPNYESIGKWYPKTWGLLVFYNNGDVVGEYRHLTPEMLIAARTGITRDNSLQGNINKALQVEFTLDGRGNIKDQYVSEFAVFGARRRLYTDGVGAESESDAGTKRKLLNLILSEEEERNRYLFNTINAGLKQALSLMISELIINLIPSSAMLQQMRYLILNHPSPWIQFVKYTKVYSFENYILTMMKK